MAIAIDVMKGGLSAGTAKAMGGQVQNAVSAAGTTLATATVLKASMNRVSTVGASSGVALPAGMMPCDSVVVFNAGANLLTVYPPRSTVAINQLSAGTGMSLPMQTGALIYMSTSTQLIAFLSA